MLVDSATTDAANAFGLNSFPYFVLLRADGSVALRLSGEVDPVDLIAHISGALAAA